MLGHDAPVTSIAPPATVASTAAQAAVATQPQEIVNTDATRKSVWSRFGIPVRKPRIEANGVGGVNALWQPATSARTMLQAAPPVQMAMDPADAAVVAGFENLVGTIGQQGQSCAATPSGAVAPNVPVLAAEVAAGSDARPFDVTPHGDAPTLCNMKKLDTIMKVRATPFDVATRTNINTDTHE